VYMCAMTSARVGHDSITREIYLIHTWDMTYLDVKHDATTCET